MVPENEKRVRAKVRKERKKRKDGGRRDEEGFKCMYTQRKGTMKWMDEGKEVEEKEKEKKRKTHRSLFPVVLCVPENTGRVLRCWWVCM